MNETKMNETKMNETKMNETKMNEIIIKEKTPGYLIVYKPIGITCGELVEELSKNSGYKDIAYAGRLDPLAHGDITILLGKEKQLMDFYTAAAKTYYVKFIIGLSTDTTDFLGLISGEPKYKNNMDLEILCNYIFSAPQTYTSQKYHKFSSFNPSILFDGKKRPAWWWSSHHPEIQLYLSAKAVTIYDVGITDINLVDYAVIFKNIIKNVSSIDLRNNLRQKEIITCWNEYVPPQKEFVEIEFNISVSSGFYIRQFVQDISDKFKTNMIVSEIHRLKTI